MKIVVCGNYGAGNIGDEMILEGMLGFLKKVAPKAKITVLSANPAETEARHKVTSCHFFPAGFRSILKAFFKKSGTSKIVKDCDYFILGGGGLFGDLTLKAYLIWGMQAFMACHYKKPVVMLGQSIGPVNGVFKGWIVKKTFQKAKFIGVRDSFSKKELEKLGIKSEIRIIPDLALKLEIKDELNRDNKIIVAMRQMKNIPAEFKQEIAKFLLWLIKEKNFTVEMTNFQKGGEADEKIHQQIYDICIRKNPDLEKSKLRIINNNLIKEFQKAKIVLGMRLHSIITATKTQTPFIAINYSRKVENFVRELGLENQIIEMDRINAENLKEKFTQTLRNEFRFRKIFKKFLEQTKEKFNNFPTIFSENPRQ